MSQTENKLDLTDATLLASTVRIKRSNFAAAYEALHELAKRSELSINQFLWFAVEGGLLEWKDGEEIIHVHQPVDDNPLIESLAGLGWEARDVTDEAAEDIWLETSYGEDEPLVWQTLAPFVEANGYLEFHDRDTGDRWRWWFTGERMIEQQARIVYPVPE